MNEFPEYAYIANGDVLYIKRHENDPGSPWKIVVDSAKPEFAPDTQDLVQIGWDITDTTASRIWQVLDKAAPDASVVRVAPSSVPEEVPLWAFRAVLTIMGIAPQVDALIGSLDEPAKTVAQVQWEFGNYILRNHPLIAALGSQLGLSSAQIDAVFTQANSLK